MKLGYLVLICVMGFFSVRLMASEGFSTPPSGDILATGSGRVSVFGPDGLLKRTHPTGNNADAWMLPGGNILFADGSVKEVSPEGDTVWIYTPENQTGGGAYSCQRLPDGNTLIGENSTARILELDREKQIKVEIQTHPKTTNAHHRMRMVRKLPNGNYLVCHSGDREVKEYRPDGSVVWEQKVPNTAFAAVRLPDGNTLISSLDQVQKWSSENRLLWEFKATDLPELGIRNMTGIHALPDGNLVIGCYSAYAGGKGIGMFEITPEKKLVWSYISPQKRDKSMMGVQLIGADINAPLR